VAFDETNGSKVLTLSYGDAGVSFPNEGIFNAYFVSLAGTKVITKIEVTTDVKTYTKEVNKSLVFKTPDFKSIAVNMDGATGGNTPQPQTQPQSLSFVRGGKTFTVNNPDNYDLSNGAANYVAPTLTGVQGSPAPTVTWTIVCNPANCASVNQNGAVTLNGTGTSTITATVAAVGNYQETAASYKLVVTESSLPQQTVSLTKGGNTITEDTYVLGSGDYKMPAVETNALEYSETWSVSNSNAAIENNKVVPKAAGDVVVTVTVEAPGYATKEVSYTLHITGSTPEPPTPTAQNLSFSPTSVSGKVGEAVTKPTLTGANTTVTYSSSNTIFVDVDASTGDLTLKAVGSATITATAAAGTVGGVTYAEGSATYTVTVSPADPAPATGKTYTLIEGDANLVTGTYVIADKTNAYLLNASGSNNGGYSTINSTTGVTLSGSTITLSESIAEAHEFVITRTGDNLTVKKVGGDHAGQYLFASSGVTNSYMGFQSSAATFVINKQTNTNLIYFSTTKSSTSPTEYLYKKAADSYFKLGQSGAPGGSDAGIYLYKLNGGSSTPEPPTPSTPTYTKVDEITSGGTYLIVSTDSGNYNGKGQTTVFAGDEAGTAATVDGTSGTISGDYSAYEFVITKKNNDYVLNGPNGYVTGNSSTSYSRYIQVSNSEVTMSLTTASDLKNADSGDGKVSDAFYFYYTKSNSKEVLYLNSDGKYKIGGSGRKYGVYLYKKN
jgi:hypothetical protein